MAMLNAVSRPCHGCFKSRSGGRPEKCVSSSRTVICPFPFCANSGRYAATGSFEPDASLIEQLHHRGCGGNHLGQRGQIEDRIRGHGFVRRFERPGPEGPAIDHRAIVADDHDAARHAAFSHGRLHQRVDGAKIMRNQIVPAWPGRRSLREKPTLPARHHRDGQQENPPAQRPNRFQNTPHVNLQSPGEHLL